MYLNNSKFNLIIYSSDNIKIYRSINYNNHIRYRNNLNKNSYGRGDGISKISRVSRISSCCSSSMNNIFKIDKF